MDKIDNYAFGNRLKEALEEAKVTQKRFAEITGISKTSINNYVQGRIPDASVLYHIASTLKISIEWLLTGKEYVSDKQGLNKQDSVKQKLDNRDEIKLINSFAKMTAEQKKQLEGNIRTYIAAPGYQIDGNIDLTEEEVAILELYRNLTNTDKLKIEGMLEINISETTQQKNKKLYSSPDSEFAGDISVS